MVQFERDLIALSPKEIEHASSYLADATRATETGAPSFPACSGSC